MKLKGSSLRKLILIVAIIITSGLFVFFELQYGFVIPETLPENQINNISDFTQGSLLYNNSLANQSDVNDWVMEGPGELNFTNNWMRIYSPNEEFHHVFWCPEDFPNSFIAQWKVQNLEIDAGLCIVFFAAKGLNGENVLNSSSQRTGVFEQYTRSLNNYHISYYANARNEPGREISNLRKNNGFNLVQNGRAGIPIDSTSIHTVTLVKDQHHIVMFIDSREIINWIDNGIIDTQPHTDGKIGFRQMKSTNFKYCNFTVWVLANESSTLPAVSPISIPSVPFVIVAIVGLVAILPIISIIKRIRRRKKDKIEEKEVPK